MSDLRFALRRIRQSPLFSLFAIVTLAIAIGITTAVYSLLRVGLQPFVPVDGADRLMAINSRVSWLDFQDVATNVRAFETTVAWAPALSAVTIDRDSEFTLAELVTGNYFRTIGAHTSRGRLLDESDDKPNASPVAVVSESMWRRRLRSADDAIGRVIRIAGHQFQIVGVVRDPFQGIDRRRGFGRAEVWLPLSAAPLIATRYTRQDRNRRDHAWLSMAGLLAVQTTRERAAGEMAQLAKRLDAAEPLPGILRGDNRPTPRAWTLRGVNDAIDLTDAKDVFRVVLLLPTLVLLIACTNLANFALSRGLARRNELAVRQALGASRVQLIKGPLIEYSVIAVIGAGAGIAIAAGLLSLVAATARELGGEMPQFRIDASIDGSVLMAVGGAALLSILVAGLLPALKLTGRGLARSIACDESTASLPKWRGRGNLIALQVSVSVALLLVSALCVRQLPKLRQHSSGLTLERVALVSVPFERQSMTQPSVRRILDQTLEAVRRLPGVALATAGSNREFNENVNIAPMGQPMRKDPGRPWADLISIEPDYLQTLDLELVRGRTLGPTDTAGSEPVGVLSAHAARTLFGTIDAVEQRINIQSINGRDETLKTLTVVGITVDTRTNRGTTEPFLYVPMTQRFEEVASIDLMARVDDRVEPAMIARRMRETLQAVEPDVAVSYVGGADDARFGPETALKMFTVSFGGLAFLALAFAMSGLYGVLSHIVARRTRELGVRSALGADQSALIRLVMKDGARPVIEGIVIGFGIAVGARLGMQPWFTEPVTAVDPVALVIALAPLLAAAVIACYLPARRAAQVSPNVSLRHL